MNHTVVHVITIMCSKDGNVYGGVLSLNNSSCCTGEVCALYLFPEGKFRLSFYNLSFYLQLGDLHSECFRAGLLAVIWCQNIAAGFCLGVILWAPLCRMFD